MEFKELEIKVIKWAKDKNLLDVKTNYQQYAKFLEEGTEILDAMNKLRVVEDKANKLDVTDADQMANHKHILDEAELELKDAFGDTIVTLIILAGKYKINLIDCLELAYNEIKGRTGKTVGGTFIKD